MVTFSFKEGTYYFSTSILKNEKKLSFGKFEQLLLRVSKREVSISFGKPSKSKLTFVILARKTLKINFLTKSRRNFFWKKIKRLILGVICAKMKTSLFFKSLILGVFRAKMNCWNVVWNNNSTSTSQFFLSHHLKRQWYLSIQLFRPEVVVGSKDLPGSLEGPKGTQWNFVKKRHFYF